VRNAFDEEPYDYRNVLSIAGSDSSGGAGIQADLKTMCALGVYGMTAITAVTAQNTHEVTAVEEVAPAVLRAQLDAVFSDIRVDAVKIGMVFSAALIDVITACLDKYKPENVVIDPVIVSKTGANLLQEDAAIELLDLLTRADIVTPNIPEAEVIEGMKIYSIRDMIAAGKKLCKLGPQFALIKGGHRLDKRLDDDGQNRMEQSDEYRDKAVDVLVGAKDGTEIILCEELIHSPHTHGTGCTLSSAIACRLALGDDMIAAVTFAKQYVHTAIQNGYAVGRGSGPVGHLIQLYRKAGMC
jgi:hydroxymethylpyrimidine/phosphomethylpyrimidine kinase